MNRRSSAWTQVGIFTLLVLIGVVTRVAADRLALGSTPAEPFWYALASICGPTLFGAFYLSRKWAAVLVPLLTMFISDLLLPGYPNIAVQAFIYVLFAGPLALGWLLKKRLTPVRFFGAAAGSTLFFFLASNLPVWVVYFENHSWATLLACYAEALPFYKYKFVGDLGWSSALFGAYLWATHKGWLPAVKGSSREYVAPSPTAPLRATN